MPPVFKNGRRNFNLARYLKPMSSNTPTGPRYFFSLSPNVGSVGGRGGGGAITGGISFGSIGRGSAARSFSSNRFGSWHCRLSALVFFYGCDADMEHTNFDCELSALMCILLHRSQSSGYIICKLRSLHQATSLLPVLDLRTNPLTKFDEVSIHVP